MTPLAFAAGYGLVLAIPLFPETAFLLVQLLNASTSIGSIFALNGTERHLTSLTFRTAHQDDSARTLRLDHRVCTREGKDAFPKSSGPDIILGERREAVSVGMEFSRMVGSFRGWCGRSVRSATGTVVVGTTQAVARAMARATPTTARTAATGTLGGTK